MAVQARSVYFTCPWLYLLCNNFCHFRNLTNKQRAVLLAFAEEETGVSGTVEGTTKTNDGMYRKE